eukprot:s223_g27.t1
MVSPRVPLMSFFEKWQHILAVGTWLEPLRVLWKLVTFFEDSVSHVTSGPRVPHVPMGELALPALAFGVGSAWLGDKEQQQKLKRTVQMALDAGFRHLDLAEAYDNSHVVGEAVQEWLQKTGCRREDRLHFCILGLVRVCGPETRPVCDQLLKDCKVDYFDLFLLHCAVSEENEPFAKPFPKMWEEMMGGSASSGRGTAEWELISEADQPEGQLTDLDRRRSLVQDGDYEGFAELIPECPRHLINGCKRLTGGGVSFEFRARRAFEAGYWARLALAGRLAKPRGTLALDLAPKVEDEEVPECPPEESSAPYVPLMFRWPSTDGGDPYAIQAIQLLQRPNGILMAFPGEAVTEEMLELAISQTIPGEEPWVGAHMRFTVPTFFGQEDPERSVEILVVDLASPPANSMFEPFAEDLPDFPFAQTFLEEGRIDLLNSDNLMAQVREWLAQELGDRMVFYSAQEEEEPPETRGTPSRRRSALRANGQSPRSGTTTTEGHVPPGAALPKASQKKPTVASLASKVDQIMGILPTLTAQLQSLADQQERMAAGASASSKEPPSSQARPYTQPAPRASMAVSAHLAKQTPSPAALAHALGPPPRTRTAPEGAPTAGLRQIAEDDPLNFEADPASTPQDHYLQALIAQSRALNTLVSHIHSSQTDPMADLASSTPSLGVKGSAGREKLQRELSLHSGQFYLKVCQNIQRRMDPAGSMPMTVEEARGTSLTNYLERFGGFGQQRELGLVMWALAHVFNHASRGNMAAVQDHVALLAVMLEQAALDGGQWQVAWLLGLLDDPPQNLWLNRNQAAAGGRKPFGPLCAQAWATTSLAYLKENEILFNKRVDSDRTPSAVPYQSPGGEAPGSFCMPAEFTPLPPGLSSIREVGNISFSFSAWCFSIIRWILSTRTDFGRYLASVLSLRRDGPESPPTALFPLPLPSFHPTAAVDPKMSRKEKYDHMLDRPLLVVICALNYAYCERAVFPPELLRRQPNDLQRQAIDRLRLLVRASNPGTAVEVASSGRKNLALVARLQELLSAALALGFSSNPYHEESAGIKVPKDNSWDPKLKPYSSLNPERLKITGSGSWEAANYLPDELWMPYVEPQILELDRPVCERGIPNLEAEDRDAVWRLLMKWDQHDLLELHSAKVVSPGCEGKVKIFNAYKSPEHDRQIGDRRWRNAFEGRIPGPSKTLPTGAQICRLLVPPLHSVDLRDG